MDLLVVVLSCFIGSLVSFLVGVLFMVLVGLDLSVLNVFRLGLIVNNSVVKNLMINCGVLGKELVGVDVVVV